jgi:ribosomal protein S18 acetylase RimI-like enzyme
VTCGGGGAASAPRGPVGTGIGSVTATFAAPRTPMQMLNRSGGGYDAPDVLLVPGKGGQVMPAGLSVRRATLADAPRLAQALASAFQDDPVIAWIFPDQHRRCAVLAAFMEFRLHKLAFPHDQVWMTAGGAAAAAWLPPPGRWQLSGPQRLRLLPPLVRFFGLRTASVLAGLERMEKQHPDDRSHWYLFILGTEPAAQGQGLGSALLDQMLARVDADGMPVYLESSSERNLALYGRHGFELTGELVIPGGPRIWPMWREPRP